MFFNAYNNLKIPTYSEGYIHLIALFSQGEMKTGEMHAVLLTPVHLDKIWT